MFFEMNENCRTCYEGGESVRENFVVKPRPMEYYPFLLFFWNSPDWANNVRFLYSVSFIFSGADHAVNEGRLSSCS